MVPDNRRAAERDDPEETDTYTSGVITSKDPVPTTKKFTRTEKNLATRPSTSRTGTNKKLTGATEEVACPKKVCANDFSFSCTGTNIKLIRATEEVPANRSDTSRTGPSKSVRVPKEVARSKKAPDTQFYLERKSSKSDRGSVLNRPRPQAAKDSKRGKGLGAERDLVVPRRTPSSKVKQTPVSDSQVQQEAYGVSEPSIEPARTHRGRISPVEMHTLRAPYPMGVGPPTGSEERTRGRRCQSLGRY